MARVLVVGDVGTVLVSPVARLPERGENFLLERPSVYASGVAANLAWNLRELEMEADVASGIGRDPLGDALLGELEDRGIGVGHVHRAAGPTGLLVILVDPAGERTMIGFRGAAERFPVDPSILEERAPDWVHVSGYTLTDAGMAGRCQELVSAAEARGIRCSVDLEGIAYAGRRTPLDRLTTLCNLDEYRAYFGQEEVRPVERSAPLVVKAGEAGAFLVDGGSVSGCPTRRVPAVDSTGAGDAFNAGFIVATLRGETARVACSWGNAAAGSKVGRPGPRADLSVDVVERIVRERAGGG